jgi:5-methylcytosine-specific restriction endonuclease McrA
MKCKTCGKNSQSDYCFAHKPRKPLSSGKGLSKMSSKPQKKLDKPSEMKEFFMDFWKNNKQHTCEVCSKHLGDEPRTYMFDHVLEKSKYPELAFVKENIMYLCLECHDEKTRGHHSDVTIKRIEYLKAKYDK